MDLLFVFLAELFKLSDSVEQVLPHFLDVGDDLLLQAREEAIAGAQTDANRLVEISASDHAPAAARQGIRIDVRPGDVPPIRGNAGALQPALDKAGESFLTEGGQRFAEQKSEAIRNEFFHKTAADMSTSLFELRYFVYG